MFTPSPNRSSPSTMRPLINPDPHLNLLVGRNDCISLSQAPLQGHSDSTASTTDEDSASFPSPISLKMAPW